VTVTGDEQITRDQIEKALAEADTAIRKYVEVQLESEFAALNALEHLYRMVNGGVWGETLGAASGFAAKNAIEYALTNIVSDKELEALTLRGEPIRTREDMDELAVGNDMPARYFLKSWGETVSVVSAALEHAEPQAVA
jgi:hypothetical protein